MANLKTKNDEIQYSAVCSSPYAVVEGVLRERGYSSSNADVFTKRTGDSNLRINLSPCTKGRVWRSVRDFVGDMGLEEFANGSRANFQELTLQGLAPRTNKMSDYAFSELCDILNDSRLGKVRVFSFGFEEYDFSKK